MTTTPVEHLDVLIIGAGLSGIGAAYHLRLDHPQRSVALLEARGAARAAKDFAEADRLRDVLRSRGWEVRDGAGGAELVAADPVA